MHDSYLLHEQFIIYFCFPPLSDQVEQTLSQWIYVPIFGGSVQTGFTDPYCEKRLCHKFHLS